MGERFENIVLNTILLIESDNAYGVPIRKKVSSFMGKEVSIGALYMALERLEKKGFVESRKGEVTEERGGRAKMHFSVTESGKERIGVK